MSKRSGGAESWRVELCALDGDPVGTAVTTDTTIAVESLSPAPLPAGEWRVVPIDADGLERAARPQTAFRVRSGRKSRRRRHGLGGRTRGSATSASLEPAEAGPIGSARRIRGRAAP